MASSTLTSHLHQAIPRLVLLLCFLQNIKAEEPCPRTFNNQQVDFKFCHWLDANQTFRLAWNPPDAAGVVQTYFSGPPDVKAAPGQGWSGWGVTQTMEAEFMDTGRAVVGFINPTVPTEAKALPYTLLGTSPATWKIGEANSTTFNVQKNSLQCEVSDGGKRIAVRANIEGLGKTTQVVSWRGGQGVQDMKDYTKGTLKFHTDMKEHRILIDFTNGTATAPTPEAPPPSAPTPSTCITNFRGKYMIHKKCAWLDAGQKFRLAWVPAPDGSQVHIFFRGVPEKPYGWAGWGIKGQSFMVGSNAVVGLANPSTGDAKASQYSLQGSDVSMVVPVTSNPMFSIIPGTLQVQYTEKGNVVKVRANFTFPTSGLKTVFWHGGSEASDFAAGTLSGHKIGDGPDKEIDFFTGDVGATSTAGDTTTYKIAHAWLCGLGFAVLMPLGILVARHVKLWADPLWFYSHIGLQFLGFLTGVAGWGIGVWLSTKSSPQGYPQKQFAHYAIGITIFCTATLQILTPALKPHKGAPVRLYWNLVHWGLGYSTVVLSIANVFLGFWILAYQRIGYGPWQTVYIVYIAVWGALMLVLEPVSWYLYLQRSGEQSDDEDEDYDEDDDDHEKGDKRYENGEEDDSDEERNGHKKGYYDE